MSRQIEKPFEIFKRKSKVKPVGVRTRGDNGEVLNNAQGFKTKQKALVNIRATARVVDPGLTDDDILKLTNDLTK